jgi:polar amino acid transport system substrate-binding protein
MKRLALSMLALAWFPSLARAQATCDALVITGHPAYPPVAWEAKGKIVGAGPELVTEIARKLGVKKITSQDFGSWEKAIDAARDGRADVILGIYRTDERAKFLDYVEPPFMLDPTAVVVRKGATFPFAKWGDLKGRKGVTNAGESFGDAFDAFMAKELTIARSQGVDKAFETLVAGKADYLIIGLYPGRKEAKRLGLEARVEFLPQGMPASDMYVAFSRKSPCAAGMKAAFAAGMKAAVDGGEVKALLERAGSSVR